MFGIRRLNVVCRNFHYNISHFKQNVRYLTSEELKTYKDNLAGPESKQWVSCIEVNSNKFTKDELDDMIRHVNHNLAVLQFGIPFYAGVFLGAYSLSLELGLIVCGSLFVTNESWNPCVETYRRLVAVRIHKETTD